MVLFLYLKSQTRLKAFTLVLFIVDAIVNQPEVPTLIRVKIS